MVVIRIESIGEEKFVRGLNRYVAQMKDFSEVFKQIQEDFWEINARNFKSAGSPEPFRVATSPRYVEWKRRKVGHNKPLILFGTLRDSLTGKKKETISDINKTNATFGTTVPYANYHYYARDSKAVQLTEADKVRWARMIQVWAYKKWQEMAVAPSLRSAI